MMDEILLRPHHALCIRFFEGKGYSSEFTKSLNLPLLAASILQMIGTFFADFILFIHKRNTLSRFMKFFDYSGHMLCELTAVSLSFKKADT